MEDRRVASAQPETTVTKLLKAPSRYPKTFSFLGLYLFGVLVMAFFDGYSVSPETEEVYQQIMVRASNVDTRDAMSDVLRAEARVSDAKEWFWWFNSAKRKKVHLLQEELAVKELVLAELIDERRAIENEAKNEVGLFSIYGVQEARMLFWQSFYRGKQAAKEMSWFDFIFGVSMGYDESLISFLFRMVISMLLNITIGLVFATISFMGYLYVMITDFGPSFVDGLLFFIVASIAAWSCVISVLGAIFGTVGTVTYIAVRNSADNAIGGAQQRQRLHLD